MLSLFIYEASVGDITRYIKKYIVNYMKLLKLSVYVHIIEFHILHIRLQCIL